MIYLGRYLWDTSRLPEKWGFWRPPSPDWNGSLDLRSLAAVSTPGGPPQGWGIFSYASDPGNPDLIPLGDDPEGRLSAKMIDDLQQALRPASPIQATRFHDVLWELLTSDSRTPDGSRWKGLMPGHDRTMELWLANTRIKSAEVGIGAQEWPGVQSQHRADYASLKAEVDSGKVPADLHQKMLGTWLLKYRTDDPSLFVPIGQPVPDPKEPTTSISDDFTRADGDTIGNQLSWTELSGDTDTVSNRAGFIGSGTDCNNRANSDLSSDDHYAQVTITAVAVSGWAGALVRKNSTATMTYYTAELDLGASPDTWATYKNVAGTYTGFGTNTSVNFAANDVIKIAADGSTITRYRNGSSQNAATDTAITGNLRTGMRGGNTGTTVDNFEAADLAAPVDAAMMVAASRGHQDAILRRHYRPRMVAY